MNKLNNFKNRSKIFRSSLIMLGFKYIPTTTEERLYVYIYRKKDIIVQIKRTYPEDIRTWKNIRNLQIFTNFDDVLISDRIQN